MVQTVNQFYRKIFHKKVYKLALDAGCTCPNRDGTVGTGGCSFCGTAGSGEFSVTQIEKAKSIVNKKIGAAGAVYIAYFQSFTNTYGESSRLFALWDKALSCKEVVGLALATRPDCLNETCLEHLGKLAEKYFVQVELGLQTADDKIAKNFNRGYDTCVYFEAVKKLHLANPKIHVVTHVLFGLPDESSQSMLNTVRAAIKAGTDGIKIANLYVLRDTALQKKYEKGDYVPLSMDEYFLLLKEAILLIPESVVVHRLTGDPPKRLLVAPEWPCDKKRVLNRIKELISSY